VGLSGGRPGAAPEKNRAFALDVVTAGFVGLARVVGQGVGERRPREQENHAAVRVAYRALGHAERVRYHWYAGDHDFPPEARRAAVEWFRRWFAE
jgi:hypothetical protein